MDGKERTVGIEKLMPRRRILSLPFFSFFFFRFCLVEQDRKKVRSDDQVTIKSPNFLFLSVISHFRSYDNMIKSRGGKRIDLVGSRGQAWWMKVIFNWVKYVWIHALEGGRKCAIFWVFWGIWTESNAWLFRDSYIYFVLLQDKIFFLPSLWASAMDAFRSIFVTNLL